MAVTVSGMFGNGKTYFAGSPVVIDISGLEWTDSSGVVASPFTIVRVNVIYNGAVVGKFHADTGGQTSISFDISSALRAIWSDFDYTEEVASANQAAAATSGNDGFKPGTDGIYQGGVRRYRAYSLDIYTEYLDSQDGEFVTTYSGRITGGQCAIGGLTEWERRMAIIDVGDKRNADVSYREHDNLRNGDASTKPTSSPERVGKDSITSWVDVASQGTESVFYPASAASGAGAVDSQLAHAPIVLRDDQRYVDFLFVNRRGAVETCSAQTLEGMEIDVETQQYSRVERPTFNPSRTIMAISKGGRRSWSMSSGHQTRDWAEWWTMEFLRARQWWMRYPVGKATGVFVPVTVEPAKKSIGIYDRSKQEMPSVEFTVTLALEG